MTIEMLEIGQPALGLSREVYRLPSIMPRRGLAVAASLADHISNDVIERNECIRLG